MAESRIQLRHPVKGKKGRDVDRARYELVRKKMLAVVPKRAPGIRLGDLKSKMVERVGKRLRPGSHDWWTMAVKLHLEAAGEVKRIGAAPQRIVRVK